MGLDLVELVMELEDEFQISIPDQDAQRIGRPLDPRRRRARGGAGAQNRGYRSDDARACAHVVTLRMAHRSGAMLETRLGQH